MNSFYSAWTRMAVWSISLVLWAQPLTAAPYAVVGNRVDGHITIRDLGEQTAPQTIIFPVAQGNADVIAISPDGSTACVAESFSPGDPEAAYNFFIIDLSSKTITNSLKIGSSTDSISGAAFTPDGTKIYVAYSHGVAVVDVKHARVLPSIAVGISPQGIAIAPDGFTAYVTNGGDNTISVINLQANTVSATLSSGFAFNNPKAIAITPDGKKAYVGNLGNNTVEVIDTATNQPLTTPISTSKPPVSMAVTLDGTKVFVSTSDVADTEASLEAIDTATNVLLLTPFPLLIPPGALSMTPDGAKLCATDYLHGGVTVIDVQNPSALPVHITGQVDDASMAITGILAPSKFEGKLKVDGSEVSLKVKWKKSKAEKVKEYEIYKLNEKVATISTKKRHAVLYVDPFSTVSYINTVYKIRAIDKEGNVSTLMQLHVKNWPCKDCFKKTMR